MPDRHLRMAEMTLSQPITGAPADAVAAARGRRRAVQGQVDVWFEGNVGAIGPTKGEA